jgi:hypothetical protein
MTNAYGLLAHWWLLAAWCSCQIWLARRSWRLLGRVVAAMVGTLAVRCLIPLARRCWSARRRDCDCRDDRSQSIPAELGEAALDYLSRAAAAGTGENQLAIVDVAEAASISKLPSTDTSVRRRNTTLTGQQSRLASGIEMAMAIAPPDTATRILLLTEGNETEGDLKEAAKTAAANQIPIDVLPLPYRYESEALFKRVVAPPRARSGQTVSLRFILNSTAAIAGKLLLTLNGKP